MTEQRLGRRQFLTSAGLLAGGATIGAAGGLGLDHRSSQHDPPASGPTATVAFEGAHQPGIVDRQPAVLRFLSLDLT
ncbi:MAG: peroxidase, partial [Actinomycetota bacterium]|nr:peroxidase [Actinomycetota bacterium]